MQLDDLLKSALGPVIAICIAGLVGHWLAARWALWQKRREIAFNAAKDFYRAYGEFFAIGKMWQYSIGALKQDAPQDIRWKLLERAAEAEATIEALLVQLAAERRLSDDECDDAGKLRQAIQSLREAIRDCRSMNWQGADDSRYVALKALSCRVGHLIASSHEGTTPSHQVAWKALRRITSNREGDWWHGWWEKPS